ncbi:MAG: PAS domain S-box protein [Spirochaetia bacterium]|nr:PAS domain S-box protein [Spirochaetia bacterium]
MRNISDRKQKEKQLKKSEKNLRITLNSIGDAVISTDMEGNIVRMNPVAEELTGWSIKKAKGRKLNEIFYIINSYSCQPVDNPVEKVIQTGEIVGLANHTALISKDRTEYQIADSASPIKDDEGNINGVVLVFRDVTEKYIRERQLKESEEKYKSLFNDSPVNITVHDKDTGEVVDANKVAYTSYGYESLSVFKENDFWMEPPYSFNYALEWIHKAASEGIQNFEWKNRKASGEVFWEYVTLRPITINGMERVFATAIDITERKQAEEALKASRDLLNATQRIAQVGGWEWDVAGQTITWADQTYLIHGFKPGEFAAGSPSISSAASRATIRMTDQRSMRLFGNVWKKARPILSSSLLPHLRGRRIWVQTSAQAVLDKGRVVKVQGHIMDITDRKQAEDKLRDALKEKEFLMRELNHRVKNNLAMVSSLINLKDSETESDLSDLKHRIDVIKLVHEKLHQHNDVEHIEVKEYFQELLESIFYSTSRWTVQITNTIEDVSIPTKTAIPLGLVVNEIATNAVKYGFTEYEEAQFSVDMRKDTDSKHYTLTLSNTGNPFPEEIELENPETMGLQLVSTLVAQLNGTIELQKTPNPVFTIRFPIGEE